MLPASVRMTDATDFHDAVRRGRRCGGPLLVVHLLAPPEGDRGDVRPVSSNVGGAKVGFIVSRQVGGSVVRHRVQRRLRHAARNVVPHLPPGSRLVVRALPPAAAASFRQLHEDLDRGVVRCLSQGRSAQARASRADVGRRSEEGMR